MRYYTIRIDRKLTDDEYHDAAVTAWQAAHDKYGASATLVADRSSKAFKDAMNRRWRELGRQFPWS